MWMQFWLSILTGLIVALGLGALTLIVGIWVLAIVFIRGTSRG